MLSMKESRREGFSKNGGKLNTIQLLEFCLSRKGGGSAILETLDFYGRDFMENYQVR